MGDPSSGIFSTYSGGENRVTASFLAVLKCLSLDRIERLLRALLGEESFILVRFENQPAAGGHGVPDAIIKSSVRILIETKLRRNSVDSAQVGRHLERLNQASEATARLLLITPDDAKPRYLDSLNHDKRVAWASFAALDQAIDEVVANKHDVISERETFLLRELQNMLDAEGLLASENDVVVVAARIAWPEYNNEMIRAYVCQPNRFRPVSRIAFYSDGEIQKLVPKILERYNDVEMTRGTHSGVLGNLVNYLLDNKLRNEGEHYEVLLLSVPESPETMHLPKAIRNDLQSKAGRLTAFVQGHKYVSSKALLSAKATSELAALT